MRTDLAVLVLTLSTTFLAGLSVVVQLLVYPAFTTVGLAVDAEQWAAYHRRHSNRIAMVVAVPWLLQGLATAALLVVPPSDNHLPVALAVVLSAATLVVTVAGALPAHAALARGFSVTVVRRLLLVDLVRTVAWCGCAALGIVVVLRRASFV